MSDANEPIDTIDLIEVDLRAWVDASAANPTLHRDRMVEVAPEIRTVG